MHLRSPEDAEFARRWLNSHDAHTFQSSSELYTEVAEALIEWDGLMLRLEQPEPSIDKRFATTSKAIIDLEAAVAHLANILWRLEKNRKLNGDTDTFVTELEALARRQGWTMYPHLGYNED